MKDRLRKRVDSGFHKVVAGNAVTLLHDGKQAFPSMLEAIGNATTEIVLEMYWFDSTPIGLQFAKALSDKARAGVRVCVIYDSVGSIDADPTMFDAMRASGCEVEEFHPVAPWRKRFNWAHLNRRDHRKILVCDGRVGFTGGVNLGSLWLESPDTSGTTFRDDMVRIEGPAASQLRRVFFSTWKRLRRGQTGSFVDGSGHPFESDSASPGATPVRILTNASRGARRAIHKEYLGKIRAASKSIFITNSYFIPERSVRKALLAAARRGVKIGILLPLESDVPAVQYACRFLYGQFLRAGVQLYEWRDSILHSKTAVIDEHWSTVGTHNIDHRSIRYNLEVNAVIEDHELGQAMRERFERDAALSVRVTLDSWRFRPLLDRLFEGFFYLFRKLL